MTLASLLHNRLPDRLSDALEPFVEKVDLALSGDGARSVAARAALLTFAMRVLAAVLAYGGQVVLARMMGAYDYGVYAIVWVWLVVLSAFTGLGYSTGLLRFIPELRQSGRIAELRTVIVHGSLITVAVCTLIAAFGVGLVLAVPHWFDNAFFIPVVLAAFCLPMLTLVDNQSSIAQAFDWPVLVTLPAYIVRPLFILAMFIAMTAGGVEPTAASAMIATIAGVWVVALGQFFVLRRRVLDRIGPGPMQGPVSPWIKAALPMLLIEGFVFLILNTDVMVAGWFVPPDQVAIYYAAAKTLALVHFVSFAIRVATMHKIAQYHATGDRYRLDHTIADALRWTFWPSLALVIMLAIGGEWILSMFGEGFQDGKAFLAVLLVGVVMRASVGPAEGMLTMAGRQKTAAWIYGIVLCVNVTLNLALIPTVGLVGAAIATALSMALESLLLVLAVRRHFGMTSFIAFAGRLTPPIAAQGAAAE